MSVTSVSTLATGVKQEPLTGSPREASGSPFYFAGTKKEREHGLRLSIVTGVVLALSLGVVVRAQKWERLGPEGGMVVSLGAGPGDEIYLGTADGHVFASKDRAGSWEIRGRVGVRLDAVVTRIVADPRDGNRLFASVWYQQPGAGGGVFKSEDRGQNWKLVGLEGEAVRALEIAPSNADELVAGSRSGVFLSSDGGRTWGRISPEGDEELKNVDSLAIDPRDAGVIYAGTYHLPWLTRDGGKHWKSVIAGIIDDSDIMSLRLDASNPQRVYMSACSGIYRSENQGEEWTKLQGIPYAARRTQVIVQDAGNAKTLYAGTTEGLWVTRDGGESWTRTTSKDWDVNSVVVLDGKNGSPGRVVLGTEGRGIQVSDDAGANFAESNRGFTHVVVKQLIADERSPERLLAVIQRSALEILESRDDGKTWASVALNAVEQSKPTTLNAEQVQEVVASPWGWLLRLENGQLWMWDGSKQLWKEWKLQLTLAIRNVTRSSPAKSVKKEVARRLVADATIAFSQSEALVSTTEGLLRCQESGRCTRVKAYGHGEKVRAVWMSATGREMGVVAEGKLGLSSDGGETAEWRDLPVSTEQTSWLDITESSSGNTVYLGTGEGIYSSVSNGAWKNVAGGLPAGAAGRWLRGPGVLAASELDGGLYISRDNGASWKRVDDDAERGIFTGLVKTPSGGVLAGSQSEGLLRLEMDRAGKTGE
jgi:photosystem II stability/assembly factor-like uncharacterized protein